MGECITKSEVIAKRDKFINSALAVKDIFKKNNTELSFYNYKKTIIEYSRVTDVDLLSLQRLTIDINLWFQYFSDLEGLTQALYLKKQNMKLYVEAFPKTPKSNVQLKELSSEIIKLKVFLKQLKIQKRMFLDMSRNCMNMYKQSCENYLYRY